jgi:hypothetical protein
MCADHAASYGDEVWVCRRDEIAKHWYENHWQPEWGVAPAVPLHGKKYPAGVVSHL